MTERRQRPIPVTNSERVFLEEQKRKFEKKSGGNGDWGEFLGSVVLLGLAAIGIYALANAAGRTKQSFDVNCSVCNQSFVMAANPGTPRVVYTKCPFCQTELVVNLGKVIG